jgi:hypothetical protein
MAPPTTLPASQTWEHTRGSTKEKKRKKERKNPLCAE